MIYFDPESCADELNPLIPYFLEWNKNAVNDWHIEHPPEKRIRLSRYTLHDYIYDCWVGQAEVAVTPLPMKIIGYNRMRYVQVEGKEYNLAVWPKSIDPETLLTRNYPTDEAKRRQRECCLPNVEKPTILFVFGHFLYEDIAGSQCWTEQMWLTREGTAEDGKRFLSFQRPLYTAKQGAIPLAHQPQQTLFGNAAAIAVPITARVIIRRNPLEIAKEGETPKVGTHAARRTLQAKERSATRRKADGSKGA
jgi:hypothetical protein